MNLKTIRVEAGLKVSKNYSTITSHIQLEAELKIGEDEMNAHADLSEMAWEMVNRDMDSGIVQLNEAVDKI